MMTSKEVGVLVGCSFQHVQLSTKKALENSLAVITLKGQAFGFEMVHDERGKSYCYTSLLESKKENKKTVYRSAMKSLDLKSIEHIDMSKTTSKDEKLLLIKFYKSHNYSLSCIIKSLLLTHFQNSDKKAVDSRVRMVRRWLEGFNSVGVGALEDKRGLGSGRQKIDIVSLDMAIMGAKNRANHQGFYSVWELYCFIVTKRSGTIEYRRDMNKESIISYTAVRTATKKRLKECYGVSVFDNKGFDGWLQGYVVGFRDISYINQEWQVDATRFDFMCKIPDEESEKGFVIGRVNFTTVIDVHSGAVVGELTQTINSYDQVRVFYKAMEKMGKPEVLKTDNGKDYASAHYKRVISDLGIVQVFADVGQGRQKGSVERFFNTFQTKFSLLPGYIGNNVAKRTKIENQNASKIDVRTSKATRFDESRLLTLSELKEVTDTLLAERTKNYDAFDEFLLEGGELEEIQKRLGKSHNRKLSMEGIALNNTIYQGADLWLEGLNARDMVQAYEDIDDINRVFVFKDEKYIGVATTALSENKMSIEEHKASVKAHKANHITPFKKLEKQSKKMLEELQDSFIEDVLERRADYVIDSHIRTTKTSPKVNSTANRASASSIKPSYDPLDLVRELAIG